MNKVLFVDTLTTGMQQGRCGIYGLGGILTNWGVEGTKEQMRFEFRIRPNDNIKIVDTSLWLSGISRRQLVSFESEKDVLQKFCELLNLYVRMENPNDKIYLAGFNSSSCDLPFIREWFERNGNRHFRDYFYVQSLDIMCMSAFALADRRKEMQDFHLESVARMFNVIVDKKNEYSCLENAETCLNIFRTLNEELMKGEKGNCEKTDNIIKNF